MTPPAPVPHDMRVRAPLRSSSSTTGGARRPCRLELQAVAGRPKAVVVYVAVMAVWSSTRGVVGQAQWRLASLLLERTPGLHVRVERTAHHPSIDAWLMRCRRSVSCSWYLATVPHTAPPTATAIRRCVFVFVLFCCFAFVVCEG